MKSGTDTEDTDPHLERKDVDIEDVVRHQERTKAGESDDHRLETAIGTQGDQKIDHKAGTGTGTVTVGDETTTNVQGHCTREIRSPAVAMIDQGHLTKEIRNQDIEMIDPDRQTQDEDAAVWTSIANQNCCRNCLLTQSTLLDQIPLASLSSETGKANKIKELKQEVKNKKKEVEALKQGAMNKELALGQEIMNRMKENDGLRVDLEMATKVINSLNKQVDRLLDWNWDAEIQQIKKPRTEWGRPKKEPGF